MNLEKLYGILNDTTMQLRNGEVVHGSPELVEGIKAGKELKDLPGGVVTFDMMPHEDEASGVEKVDLFFLTIGVDRARAEARKAELIAILDAWPSDELAGGPSYITVGGTVGDQGAAFQLFALGKALGLWSIITPATFGLEGEQAQQAAGSGYIMISGYRPSKDRAAA